jgi:hypothetical protein
VANCIVPIRTFVELIEEGRAQSNCVSIYAKRIESGNVFIYRVFYPERATVSVVKNDDRKWELGELKAAQNTPVFPTTEKFIATWLAQHEFSP